MVSVAVVVILAIILVTGETAKSNSQIVECIRKQLGQDVSSYNNHHSKLASTEIVRTKQALVEAWKENGVVKTAANGQMTINKDEFSKYSDLIKSTKSGAAMTACKNKKDDEMYKEAARGAQCVFLEMKKGCS